MSTELRAHGVRGESERSSPGPSGLRSGGCSSDSHHTMPHSPVSSHGFIRAAGSLLDLYAEISPPLTAEQIFGDAWLVTGRALRNAAAHVCPRGPLTVKLGPFEAKFRDALTDVLTRSMLLSIRDLLDEPRAGELRDTLRRYIESANAGSTERTSEPARDDGTGYARGI